MKRVFSSVILILLFFSCFITFAEPSALSRALSYLNTSAFSKNGLIHQLEFEGFSHGEAESAANMCGADWKEQAARKALQYLDVSAFSEKGLIEQLEFDGFTNTEAAYGVSNCKADWYQQAALKAQQYLDISSFSTSELVSQLEFDGFTHDQAVYGAEQHGYVYPSESNSPSERSIDSGPDIDYSVICSETEYIDYINQVVKEVFSESLNDEDERTQEILDRFILMYYTEIDTGVGKASVYVCDFGDILLVENSNGRIQRLTFLCSINATDIKNKANFTPEQNVDYMYLELFILTALDSFNQNLDRDYLKETKDGFLSNLTSYSLRGYECKNCYMYYIINEKPGYQIGLIQ